MLRMCLESLRGIRNIRLFIYIYIYTYTCTIQACVTSAGARGQPVVPPRWRADTHAHIFINSVYIIGAL